MRDEGEILLGDRGRYPEAHHLIVYIRPYSETHFVGAMLTHDPRKGNIKMSENHFTDGFRYEDTYVVDAYLLKPEKWSPFRKIGRLTEEGLKFIYLNISSGDPIMWEEYNSE